MTSKKEKGRSRKGDVNRGYRTGEDRSARREGYDVTGRMETEQDGMEMKVAGMFEDAGLPGPDEAERKGVVFCMEEEPGVLELFRRSVPEQERMRRQRLPRVCAFGDFLRLLGTFAGGKCFPAGKDCGLPGSLTVFRELEKLHDLYVGKNADRGCVFPAGVVCLRRKEALSVPGESGTCEGVVIDLSDLFK